MVHQSCLALYIPPLQGWVYAFLYVGSLGVLITGPGGAVIPLSEDKSSHLSDPQRLPWGKEDTTDMVTDTDTDMVTEVQRKCCRRGLVVKATRSWVAGTLECVGHRKAGVKGQPEMVKLSVCS